MNDARRRAPEFPIVRGERAVLAWLLVPTVSGTWTSTGLDRGAGTEGYWVQGGTRVSRSALATFGLVLSLWAAPALAVDNVGAIGRIVALQVNGPDSDSSAAHDGRIHVEVGGQLEEYVWGGTQCSSFHLDEAQVATLQRGLDNPRIVVKPFWKAGTSASCLVAFQLILRDWQGLF